MLQQMFILYTNHKTVKITKRLQPFFLQFQICTYLLLNIYFKKKWEIETTVFAFVVVKFLFVLLPCCRTRVRTSGRREIESPWSSSSGAVSAQNMAWDRSHWMRCQGLGFWDSVLFETKRGREKRGKLAIYFNFLAKG